MEAINFMAPAKEIRVKTNSKPWFGNKIILARQRRNKLYKRSGLETDADADTFNATKTHLQ